METPTGGSGRSSQPGRCSLRPRRIGSLRCQCHNVVPYLASKTRARLLVRSRQSHCLQYREEYGVLIPQPNTRKGLTRLRGTGAAIAKARDGHLGRALLYHMSPPVATRRASAVVPIRRTDSRWEEDPSGTWLQPAPIQTPASSDVVDTDREEYSREICCGPYHPVDVLTSSLPTVGRGCSGRLIHPKEAKR